MENLESKIHTQQNHAQIDWFGILKLGIRYESDNIIGSLKAVIFISHIPRMHYFFLQLREIYMLHEIIHILDTKKKKSSPKHYCNARICKRTSLRREVRSLSTWVHPLSIYLKPCWMDRHLRIESSAILDWGHLFCLQPSFLCTLKMTKDLWTNTFSTWLIKWARFQECRF